LSGFSFLKRLCYTEQDVLLVRFICLPVKEAVVKKNKGLVFLLGMLAAAALACNFPSDANPHD
jgi:hypothetical protein